MEEDKEEDKLREKLMKKVYVPKWGMTRAVIPCHYSACRHNATIVDGGKVSGRGVCLLGLATGKYDAMTQCEERWDEKEFQEFCKAYSKIKGPGITERT